MRHPPISIKTTPIYTSIFYDSRANPLLWFRPFLIFLRARMHLKWHLLLQVIFLTNDFCFVDSGIPIERNKDGRRLRQIIHQHFETFPTREIAQRSADDRGTS